MLEAFVDAPQRHRQLTVFPVVAGEGPVLPFLNAKEAFESGTLTVQEKSDGRVPLLLVRNQSLYGILIREGECLVSENHERRATRSILLAGKSVTQIPATPPLKGSEDGCSGEWDQNDWLPAFPALERQVGVMAFLGKQVLGIEAVGAPTLYAALHEDLLRKFVGLAAGAGAEAGGEPQAEETDAARILESLEAADRERADGIGLGDYWKLEGPVQGGELIHDGQLVHLSVTPNSGPTPDAGPTDPPTLGTD
jgi:hypothetical protein